MKWRKLHIGPLYAKWHPGCGIAQLGNAPRINVTWRRVKRTDGQHALLSISISCYGR